MTPLQACYANMEITTILAVMLTDSTNGVTNTRIKLASDELCTGKETPRYKIV